jgi:hypothetical protein
MAWEPLLDAIQRSIRLAHFGDHEAYGKLLLEHGNIKPKPSRGRKHVPGPSGRGALHPKDIGARSQPHFAGETHRPRTT